MTVAFAGLLLTPPALTKTGDFGKPHNKEREPRFDKLEAMIADEDSAKEPKRKRKKPRRKRVSPTDPLSKEVKRFVDGLEDKYSNRFKRRPKPLERRALSLFSIHMPPYPKR